MEAAFLKALHNFAPGAAREARRGEKGQPDIGAFRNASRVIIATFSRSPIANPHRISSFSQSHDSPSCGTNIAQNGRIERSAKCHDVSIPRSPRRGKQRRERSAGYLPASFGMRRRGRRIAALLLWTGFYTTDVMKRAREIASSSGYTRPNKNIYLLNTPCARATKRTYAISELLFLASHRNSHDLRHFISSCYNESSSLIIFRKGRMHLIRLI